MLINSLNKHQLNLTLFLLSYSTASLCYKKGNPMYKIILIALILSLAGITGCATNKSSDESIQNLIAAANESVEYVKILNQFTVAAKNNDLTKMMELTSTSAIKIYGLSSFKNTYKNIIIPEITSCNKMYTNKNVMLVTKESTGIGKGFVYQKICSKSKGKPSLINIKVLNDNGRISVGAVLVLKPKNGSNGGSH